MQLEATNSENSHDHCVKSAFNAIYTIFQTGTDYGNSIRRYSVQDREDGTALMITITWDKTPSKKDLDQLERLLKSYVWWTKRSPQEILRIKIHESSYIYYYGFFMGGR